MIKLRPYQEWCVQQVTEVWGRVRAVLLVLATGGGKTVIFTSIMHSHNGAAAAVVHRKEIVSQIACGLAKLGVKHRIIAQPNTITLIRRKQLKLFGKSFVDPHAQCGVVSVQTLTSKSAQNNAALQQWVKQLTLCVFDEGHHYVKTGLWALAVEMMVNAKLLFVTATVERADGKGLGARADGFVQEMIEGPQTQWLTDQGYLSPMVYRAPDSDLDVSGLMVTASGDLNTKALRGRMVESHIVGDVVKQYKQYAPGEQTILFASDVETAHDFERAFIAADIKAVALSGKTEQAERDRELAKFEARETQVLINVDLFDEGFDVPAVVCVIMARPTESLGKYLQMVGRALRIMDGKSHAIIIDPVRNWERHGTPNLPRVWSLDSRAKGTRSANSDLIPQRVCLGCSQPYERFYKICPHCGVAPVPAGRSAPDQVEGDLQELDLEAMAALFDKIQDADMSDEQYVIDQIGRGIPRIGRTADMKRHRAGKYRRKVLHELVAWWIGVQPAERELGEKHSRFYHRFGIDIGTAFTLNAKETDALIERIQQGFTKDMTG